MNGLTINERIRWFRKDHLRISQAEFAQVIGMKQTSVSTFERNGASVSDQIVRSICMGFSVNEAWLRTGEGEMLEQPETFSLDQYLKERGCTALEMEIVKAYFDLDADTRQKVFDHFQARLSAAKERLTAAADAGQQQEEEAPPLELKPVAEMTHAEIDQFSEQLRQELHREKAAAVRSPASPGSGTNGNGPPIAAGSSGADSATG